MSDAVPDRFADPRGFTVAEILVAVAIITIGCIALMTVVPIANSALQEGKQLSTATFLADQKLEQAKNLPWMSTPANDCLGVSAVSTEAPTAPGGTSCTNGATNIAAAGAIPWLADEGATAISGFPGYSRTVRITNCDAGGGCAGITDPGMRLITVSVRYTPLTAAGAAPMPKSVQVQMMVSQR